MENLTKIYRSDEYMEQQQKEKHKYYTRKITYYTYTYRVVYGWKMQKIDKTKNTLMYFHCAVCNGCCMDEHRRFGLSWKQVF